MNTNQIKKQIKALEVKLAVVKTASTPLPKKFKLLPKELQESIKRAWQYPESMYDSLLKGNLAVSSATTVEQLQKDIRKDDRPASGAKVTWKADAGSAAIKTKDYILILATDGDAVDGICAAARFKGAFAYWTQQSHDYTIIVSKAKLSAKQCTAILDKHDFRDG